MSCQELSRLTAGPPLQLAELDGDPPDADRGLHWHDREPCPFTREEGEAFGTYVSSDMSRAAGDDMLAWACNKAYRPGNIRTRNIRTLTTRVRKAYVPEGVKSINFHEPLDGNQSIMFYHRDLLPCIKRLLARPALTHAMMYTRFRLVRDRDGIRVIGAFNTGDWYEFAHVTAQSKGGGRPVTVVPLFAGADVTVARKKISVYPFFVALGISGDNKLSEPGSWLMVACLPHYKDKVANAAGRPPTGPQSIMRRKVSL